MALTRLGYLVILMIIATAAAAIAFVLWPGGSASDGNVARTPVAATATVGPVANPTIPLYPAIEFERVVTFARLGAVTNLDATDAQQVLVNFRPDFDTSGLGTASHTFTTAPPAGRTVEQALGDAGIPVNRTGGVDVIRR